MDRIELENRLIEFSAGVMEMCKECRFDAYTFHLSKQIVRSSSSAALNYGEAQSAESRADFAHKLSLVLKELRETQINLVIIDKSNVCRNQARLIALLEENKRLVAIFQKSLNTLKKRG